VGDLVSVQAGWAIWSKHPGTRDDYSVLYSSAGPLSAAEFSSVLAHFAPGNPPSETGTPSSLPWVTLNRVGVAEQTYVGVSVQVPTEHVDATGRPVSRTSYVCVPYDDLTRDPVSYRALSESLSMAQLPHPGGGLLPLTLPRLDPAELARSILELGPDTVATIAALLLSAPVTIIGPDFPDMAVRLRLLDAVAALLPYGCRASYTAATWSDTGAGARFRIVFANRARDEASRVVWGTPARVPAEGPARGYLEYLRRITGQPTVDIMELARLIDYLSTETAPCKFEQPERALASLGEFFRAVAVAEAVDAGAVDTAEIRRLFSRGQDQQLAPERQRQMFGYLIAAGEVQDWPLISQRFSAISNGDPQGLLPSLAQACRRLLWSEAAKDLVGNYLRLAGLYGMADDMLARLMAKPKSPVDLESGLDTAAALLTEFVINDSKDPASYHRTQQALAHNPGAGAALLAHLCASQWGIANLGAAVEWLEPVLDQVLPPFNAVLGDGAGLALEPVDARAVDKLSRDGGQSSVRYLLRAAAHRRRLHLVLPGLAPWLAWQAIQQDTVNGRYWSDVAMELTPATALEAAWLDLALLATGNNPRSLFAGKFSYQEFHRQLAAAWQELTALMQENFQAGQAADDLLTPALVDFLGRYPWRASQAHAAIVNDLTRWLCANGARPQLKAAVLDPVEALRQLPPQATSGQIAEACARAYADGLLAEQTGEALAESGVITSGTQAVDVLEQLHGTLSADQRENSAMWEEAFARTFADGTFGEQTAVEFARRAARSARTEIAHQLNLLYIVTAVDIADALPALTDADADQLDRSGKFLHEILRDARKRQGGRFGRRKDAREAGE
jgi:hypothetical protein